jgi:rubrerythrin
MVMEQNRNIRTIAKFLYCSSILEEKVANAYKSLTEKVKNPLIRNLLLYISTDGLKHSIILRAMSENLVEKIKVEEEECKIILGNLWKRLIMLAEEETLKRERIEDEELISLADKMASFEDFVGEEYLVNLHLKVLRLMARELKVDLKGLEDILEWTIEDERRHELILMMIKNFVSKQK